MTGNGGGTDDARAGMLVCLAMATTMMSACGKSSGGEDPPPARVPVETATVSQSDIEETVQVVGRLTPPPGGSVVLTAPADAVIRSVLVQVGQSVARGQLLIDLDAPDLQREARSLRAEAARAGQELKRQQDLLSSGITSRRQVEEAATTATSATAAADAAEQLLARARVTAPIAGAVQSLRRNAGERVAAGDSLVEVVNSQRLDLVAVAPASVLTRLRMGQSATIHPEGSADSASGTIRGISPAIDTTTNSGTVVIRLGRFDPSFRPGSGATATVTLGIHRGVFLVPDSALIVSGSETTIFLVRADSTVKAVPVTVGVRANGLAEVIGEIHTGEVVVTTGSYGLADSMRVVPRVRREP
ncbi:MAG: efflux RND transporter periplasmic adaptor subunit [Gemmatimonadota bacterium]